MCQRKLHELLISLQSTMQYVQLHLHAGSAQERQLLKSMGQYTRPVCPLLTVAGRGRFIPISCPCLLRESLLRVWNAS